VETASLTGIVSQSGSNSRYCLCRQDFEKNELAATHDNAEDHRDFSSHRPAVDDGHHGTNTYEQLLNGLSGVMPQPIRSGPKISAANGQDSIDRAIFAACSSECLNKDLEPAKTKKGKANMKIKNDTKMTPRPNGRTTVQMVAVVAVAGTLAGAIAFSQSAKEIRGASPYIPIENEPAPRLVVDSPIPEALAKGIFWAQYRVENLHIVPVFGAGAAQTSPRVGHLHVQVDDLSWWWADPSGIDTIDIGGLPPGQHKVKIWLVDANHKDFPGQVVTLPFTVPNYDRAKVYGHAH